MFEMTMNQGLTEKTDGKAVCKKCNSVYRPRRKFEVLCPKCQRKKETAMITEGKNVLAV